MREGSWTACTDARHHVVRVALALLVAALMFTADAVAQVRRVALVRADPALGAAVTRALAAWGVQVVPVDLPPPEPQLAAAAGWAHGVVALRQVGAVVWIGEHPSLWLYDAASEQVAVRPLPSAPPYDEPTAAAVALSIKTLLRSSAIAPDAERVTEGAPAAPPAATPAAAPPAEPAPASPRVLRIEAAAGARLLTGTDSHVEPRGGLGFSIWPTAAGGHLGAGADVRAGPGVTIADPDIVGRFSETEVRLALRGHVPVEAFALEPAVGATFDIASFDGDVTSTGEHVSALRLDPGAFVGLVGDLSLGAGFSLGLYAEGAALFRTQDFYVSTRSVFSPSPVAVDLGLRAALAPY